MEACMQPVQLLSPQCKTTIREDPTVRMSMNKVLLFSALAIALTACGNGAPVGPTGGGTTTAGPSSPPSPSPSPTPTPTPTPPPPSPPPPVTPLPGGQDFTTRCQQ